MLGQRMPGSLDSFCPECLYVYVCVSTPEAMN